MVSPKTATTIFIIILVGIIIFAVGTFIASIEVSATSEDTVKVPRYEERNAIATEVIILHSNYSDYKWRIERFVDPYNTNITCYKSVNSIEPLTCILISK